MPESVQLDGYDISASQFPYHENLPRNVTLQIADAMSDPPAHMLGQYDIVNLRLFMSTVKGDEPSALLNHCIKLLSKCSVHSGLLQAHSAKNPEDSFNRGNSILTSTS